MYSENSIFSEDDLLLLPKLSSSSNKDDLKNFQHLIENYTDEYFFLNSEIESEFTLISGETHLLHDEGASSTNFLINSDTTVSISSGQHDFLLKNTNLEYDQTGGDAVLYIDDFSKISGDLNIASGNLKIVGADETYTGLPISMSEGKLQLGDQATQINVYLDNDHTANIQFFDVWTNTLTNIVEPNVSTSASLSETVSAENSLEVSEGIQASGSEFSEPSMYSPEIFSSEDLVTFELDDTNLAVSNTKHANSSQNVPGMDQLISDVISDIGEDLEIISEIEEGSEEQKFALSDLSEEMIIAVDDYSDLVWEDAIELIEDL